MNSTASKDMRLLLDIIRWNMQNQTNLNEPNNVCLYHLLIFPY